MDGGFWQVHRVSKESNTTQQLNGNMKHKADFGKSHFKIISDYGALEGIKIER